MRDPLVNDTDSLVNRARDIMGRIRRQVFTPEVTTMGACPKCGLPGAFLAPAGLEVPDGGR